MTISISRRKYLLKRAEQTLKDVQDWKQFLKSVIKTVTLEWSTANIILLQQDFITVLDQERIAKEIRDYFRDQLEMLSRV